MQVRIKRIDASLPLPKYETEGSVAFDFIARETTVINPRSVERIPSNVVVEVPKGYMLYVKDRSSTAKKKGLLITAGVVDQDFCGDNDEILMQFFNPTDLPITVERGERLAQGIFVAVGIGDWEEVESMGHKDRGGFGTTGVSVADSQSKHVDSARPKIENIDFNTKVQTGLGKLIVIDGADGSGKNTQTNILLERLRNQGYMVSKADFPQYGSKSAGLVENYLNGKYGRADDVNPYLASVFYAMDRYDASFSLRERLQNSEIIVSNRYTSSNMGHQGGKFQSIEARKKYFEWLDRYEHEFLKIPRPDLTIILYVPVEYSQELLKTKGEREYIKIGDQDIHETDIVHQNRATRTYVEMCNLFPNYELINCVQDGRLLTIEEIAEIVWDRTAKII